MSCIPAGRYRAFVDRDVIIGKQYVIRLKDVPGRTGILIHVGNYIIEIEGCTLVGDGQVTVGEKKMVTNSCATMEQLLREVELDDDLIVEIFDA